MILWNLDLLFDNPALFFTVIPIAILVLLPMLVFHEVSHGWVAYKLGDDTAKSLGRLTWNPLAHLDRVGSLMLLLVGIGWAKPVPVNPYRLGMDPRKGMAIVGAAGPLSNFLMASIASILFRLDILDLPASYSVASFSNLLAIVILFVVQINVILGVLNTLPVPPLDGFKIVAGLLPQKYAISFTRMERYAPQAFLILVLFIFFTGFLWRIVAFVVNIFLGTDFY